MTVSGLNIVPGPGANFRITGQDDTIYRLVKVTKQSGVHQQTKKLHSQ